MRICLSAHPFCTGLNPCEACHQLILTQILPRAMVAGGFNGHREQAAAFFQAYHAARHEVNHRLAQQMANFVPPTLNGAEPPIPPPEPAPVVKQEVVLPDFAPPLTDEELLAMGVDATAEQVAWEEEAEKAPLDEDPMPSEEIVQETLARMSAPPEAAAEPERVMRLEDSPPPAGPAVAKPTKVKPRAPRRKKTIGDAAKAETAQKEE